MAQRKGAKPSKKVGSSKKNQRHVRETPERDASKTMAKGANTYSRSALGRGLSVLLSPSAVSVRPKQATEFAEPAPFRPERPAESAPTWLNVEAADQDIPVRAGSVLY